MEDLYKNDPNSWLRRTNFSRTVYHRPDLSRIPISVLTKPRLGSSNPKPNQSAISVPVGQNNTFKTNKTGTASKDDPNTWLRRAYFSNTVYRRTIPSQNANQAGISIPIAENNTSERRQVTSSLKSNPDSTFTGEVHGKSDTKNNGTASKNSVISDMHKEVMEAVRKRFRAPASRKRAGAETVKSSTKPKKKRRWLQKYFGRGVCQVSTLEKSSEIR